jgi:hypothetical protein
VLGIWQALMCGLESPQKRANIRRTLQAIFEYNFKENHSDHSNLQRAGYVLLKNFRIWLLTSFLSEYII